MADGTNAIANKFLSFKNAGVRFMPPSNAVVGWLPRGYQLVINPEHILLPTDCILSHLSSDWRLVSDVNDGARVGLKAKDVGNSIRYVATLANPKTQS